MKQCHQVDSEKFEKHIMEIKDLVGQRIKDINSRKNINPEILCGYKWEYIWQDDILKNCLKEKVWNRMRIWNYRNKLFISDDINKKYKWRNNSRNY